jgi:hypothetical protein
LLSPLLGEEIHRGTWYCEKKITKIVENPFSNPRFSGIFPSITEGTVPTVAKIPIISITRPNLYGVHRFNFKIFYIKKKAWQIWHLKVKLRPPLEVKLSNVTFKPSEVQKKGVGLMQNHQLHVLTQIEAALKLFKFSYILF